jgi:hypothetical protein
VVTVLALLIGGGPAKHPEARSRPANRLARETSPYLLQHAHNPVDWYPWGAEAFARAKKEHKLVFLSIGYSSCHWCHVMERESFENDDIAKLLNKWFVCIKVDREERPDIDNIYMTALNVLSQNGGWPLSMFLTADGKPIIGGTYWPPDDQVVDGKTHGGFKSILKYMHKVQADKPKDVSEQADAVAAATNKALSGRVRGRAVLDLNRALVTDAVEGVKEEYDEVHGGFGAAEHQFRGPKFPVPCYLQLLQHEAARTKSAALSDMVHVSLDHMARGGIYDHVGGGFHRYSTERTWTVPHFEKMLYDNAQLLEVYARAYRETKKPLYRQVLLETLTFVRREMTAPEGGFYSALDADSAGEEGRFYVWTDKELDGVLGKKDARLVEQVYGAAGEANFESKYHILLLAKPLAEQAADMKMTQEQLRDRLAPLHRKLFEARGKRPRPFLDTKVLTAWNGQMIAGFAVAAQALGEDKAAEPASRPHLEAAVRAADFLLKKLRTPAGRLLRTYGARPKEAAEARLPAYLDDYAFLVHGLLCLHDVTGSRKWLDEARALTDTMIKFHADDKNGGFFYTANDHEELFARAKDQSDGAQPSGNSMAARNLVRLWVKTGDDRYRALAEKTLKAYAAPLKLNPSGLTVMADALDLYLDAQGEKQPETAAPKEAAQKGKSSKSDYYVKVHATAEPEKPGEDGKQVLSVTLTIDKGWHIGANPPGESGKATVVQVRSKDKLQQLKVNYPPGKLIRDPDGDYRIYQGTVVMQTTVQRARGDTDPLQVAVRFAACTDKTKGGRCLPPATVKLTVPEK